MSHLSFIQGRRTKIHKGAGLMKTTNKIMQICVASAVAGWSAGAGAAGFALIEQNASGMGNAYAGQAAAAENASTIFFNPAGMTRLPGKQVSGAVSAILPKAEFTNDGGSRSPAAAPAPAGGNNGGDAGDWNYIPSGYFSWQLTPKFWAGVGLTVPFGLGTDYDPNWIGRFQSQKVKLLTFDLNPSVAYQINDFVSVGAGVSIQRLKLQLDRSFFAGAAFPQNVTLADNAYGWNVGAMFNLGPQTRLGLSYRSAMHYELTGGATIAGPGFGSASAKASLALPDNLSAAFSHQLTDKWQLLGDLTWTRWSRIQDVTLFLTSALGVIPAGPADNLDLQFKDGYRAGLGANYRWTDNFMLKMGVSYDKTPVPDALHRFAFLPDSNRTAVAFGAKHQLSKAGTLDVGYTHLFLSDGGALRNKGVGFAGAQGIVSGSYAVSVNMVALQYTHAF